MERFTPKLKDEYPQLYYEHVHRYLTAREHIEGGHVLDLACGEGYGCSILAEKADSVVGLDIDSDAISHARETYQDDNVTFEIADCVATQQEAASFDYVVSFETIEHLDSPSAFIAEIRRILKPTGILIISSPDKREYTEVNAIENPHHISELYHEEFKGLLEAQFTHTHFAKQRLVAGSLIQSDPADSKEQVEFGIHTETANKKTYSRELERGLYSFAICSNHQLLAKKLGLLENKEFSNFAWDASERYLPNLARLRKTEKDLQTNKRTPSVEALLQTVSDIELQNIEYQKRTNKAEREATGHVSEIQRMQNQLEKIDSEKQKLVSKISEISIERDNFKERYQRILNTISWRITVPIRSIRRLFER